MVTFDEFLQTVYFSNTGKEYLIALGIFIGALIILNLFKFYIIRVLKRLSKKTKNNIDDFLIESFDTIHIPFYFFAALYIGTRFIDLPEVSNKVLFFIFIISIIYYAVRFAQKLIDLAVDYQVKKRRKQTKEGETGKTSMILVIGKISKGLLWVFAILVILSNLGIDITPLMAGLGIGGIAIAFAFQNILEDLFSSFSIYFDEPFKEGDYIVIGEDSGTVEHIGIKTTRIRTLKGQELVISNRELTSTRINNYKRMKERRAVFKFGVEYGTPIKKLEKINQIVTDIIKKIKVARLDRVHFKEFGAFSLDFEVIYYLSSREYIKYMDTQQEINFALAKVFEKEKIEFAFPTQTLHIKKD